MASRAFTLVEGLLVIAVVSILIALAVGAIRSTRKSAQAARKLSDTRQIGSAVQCYTAANRDLPPVVFPKPSAWPEDVQTVALHGTQISGTWFANGRSYYLLIDPYLSAEMLRGGTLYPSPLKTDQGSTVDWTPYQLTDTFYAGVDYWIPARQRPLSAWGAQGIDGVAVPSQKGMIIHPHYVDALRSAGSSAQPLAAPSSTSRTGAESVCWFDLSASMPTERELKPGIANRFRWGMNPATTTEYDPGPTILNTLFGLAGVDR